MMATPDKPRACPTCGFTDTRECDGRHDALTCLRHVVGQRDTLTHRAEVAEARLAEISDVVTHEHYNNFAAMVAAYRSERDSASLWRERCNKAEQKVDDLRAKLARAEGVVGHMRDIAEHECAYRDGCPTFGSRHGQCTGCKAREALATYEEG